MYASRDRKTTKEGKRPQRPPETNVRNGNQHNNRVGSASNNQQQEDDSTDKLIGLIRDFLQKQGYHRTLEVFKNERPNRRMSARGQPEEQPTVNLINTFDRGLRDDFFRTWNRLFGNSNEPTIKRLEFELNIYFYVFSIHPVTRRTPNSSIDKATVDHFKRYLETKGSELSKTNEFLSFYALPYIQKPQEHPAISHIFTKEWIQRVKKHLTQATEGLARQQHHKKTALQDIVSDYLSGGKECRGDCEHAVQLQQQRDQNSQILKYLENLQNHYRTMSQSAKANLLESQRKWFEFSKQLMILADRASRGENIQDKLVSYTEFLNVDVDDLVNCTKDVSLFDRNSCVTEDISLTPADRVAGSKRNERVLCPLNIGKVTKLLEEADNEEKEVEVCLVLQALRRRFNKLRNPYARREVIVSYSSQDVCGVRKEYWGIQDKLMFRSGVRVRESYLRLLNYITSDYCGIKYLIQESHLIENLIKIFQTERQDTPSKKHSLGVLQKLSLLKRPQQVMVQLGIIETIIKMLGSGQEGELSQYSFQYLTALLLNLSLRKVGKDIFQRHRVELIGIIYQLLLVENVQIRNYVNGTLYSFVCTSEILKEEAISIGMQERLQQLIKTCEEGLFVRQYQYILEKLNSKELDPADFYSEDQNQLEFDDINEKDDTALSDNDKSSEDLSNEDDYLSGEELLMKEFALVGPDAVKQHLLNRSILDENSQRKQNNTMISMGKSRRGEEVFVVRPVTPVVHGVDNDLERSLLRFNKAQ